MMGHVVSKISKLKQRKKTPQFDGENYADNPNFNVHQRRLKKAIKKHKVNAVANTNFQFDVAPSPIDFSNVQFQPCQATQTEDVTDAQSIDHPEDR